MIGDETYIISDNVDYAEFEMLWYVALCLLVNSYMIRVFFVCLFFLAQMPPQWARASSFTRFFDHTRHITVVRTALDE